MKTTSLPKQIIFLGSKPVGYYCLEFLIKHQRMYNCEVVALLTNDNATFSKSLSLKKLATTHHIKIIDSLDEIPPCDIIYSVQYHQLLKATHIAKAKQIAVNLHMAPLPDYRGCNQFSFAILDDAKEFGTTIHQLQTGIDNGAILFEDRFALPPNSWVSKLYEDTEIKSIALFKKTLQAIVDGNYKPQPQHTFADRKSSFHQRNEMAAIKQIDLNWSSEKIERHIRATYLPPFEPPFAVVDGKKIYFKLE